MFHVVKDCVAGIRTREAEENDKGNNQDGPSHETEAEQCNCSPAERNPRLKGDDIIEVRLSGDDDVRNSCIMIAATNGYGLDAA
jgi:hypothetical protein